MSNQIKSVSEFVKRISVLTSDLSNTIDIFYRGQSKQYCKGELSEDIKPSIFRNIGLIENEHCLFREFIRSNPNDFLNEKTTFEKLVKMQHYGLPTRLLDITSNALISLYFACEDYNEKTAMECCHEDSRSCIKHKVVNGLVVVIKMEQEHIKYSDSDTVSVISNIAKRPCCEGIYNAPLDFKGYKDFYRNKLVERAANGKPSLYDRKQVEREIFNSYDPISYLIHDIKEEKSYFQNCIVEEDMHKIMCVKPLLNNRRIIKQDGAFLLFGMNENKTECPSLKDDQFDVLTIHGKSKTIILDELKQLGITKDKVYPEMDKVAEYLKENYETK